MKVLATVVLLAAAIGAHASPDPVDDCRAAHAGNATAHIACLEDALRSRLPAPTVSAPAQQAAAPAPAAAPVAPPVAAAAATAAAAPAVAEPTGLGAEQAKARQRPLDAPPEQALVTIVAVRYNAEGLGTFMMADGQVWRETTPAPERRHLKAGREYPARIETSKIGGYRLYVDGIRWMYKVRRLQ